MINYSVGNNLDDEKKLVFRIDEGEYKNTVIEIHSFEIKDKINDKIPLHIEFDVLYSDELTPSRKELAAIAYEILLDIKRTVK